MTQLSSYSFCYDGFNFCDGFKDGIGSMFVADPELRLLFQSITEASRMCVEYVRHSNLTYALSTSFYDATFQRRTIMGTYPTYKFQPTFQTALYFHRYCDSLKCIKVQENGWKRIVISLPNCHINTTWCFFCPVQILSRLLTLYLGPFVHNSVSCFLQRHW